MRNLAKYSLALQVAIAGVALAQAQNDPAVRDNTGTGMPAAGTLDDRTGMKGADSDQRVPLGTVRASKLIGTEVYNQQDKHLGEIKDIVLDKDHKKVGYVVLSYGGIAGMGDKLFALPRNMVQFSPTKENRAIVSLDEQTLKNAPGFEKDKWPTEANADYYRNLDQYYRQHGGDRLTQTPARTYDRTTATGQRAEDVDNAARQAGAQPAAAQMGNEGDITWNRRASSLIGANVKSPQDENLGEINDLVIDWPAGQVRYAVLSYGGILGLGDKLFAVPMDQFQTRNDQLVLSTDKQQLKNAPGFDKSKWPDMADPQWSKPVDEFYRQSGASSLGNTGRGDLAR